MKVELFVLRKRIYIFCFDGIFDEIWLQIHAYFVFCFSNQNIRNVPIPVLVELTEAKTISSCVTIEEGYSLSNIPLLFSFLSENLEYDASNIHHFSDFEGILKYNQSFDNFWGQTIRRNLKLLMFYKSWILCVVERYF